jgi:hypothetical protein
MVAAVAITAAMQKDWRMECRSRMDYGFAFCMRFDRRPHVESFLLDKADVSEGRYGTVNRKICSNPDQGIIATVHFRCCGNIFYQEVRCNLPPAASREEEKKPK